MDLTKINQPFGTLDIDTKLALHRADYSGEVIMFRSHHGASSRIANFPSWNSEYIYHVAPTPQRDIQVPWQVFGPEVQWAARDGGGSTFCFAGDKPTIRNNVWLGSGYGHFLITSHLIGFDPGNKPWDQSLVRRPEGV